MLQWFLSFSEFTEFFLHLGKTQISDTDSHPCLPTFQPSTCEEVLRVYVNLWYRNLLKGLTSVQHNKMLVSQFTTFIRGFP